jgi:protein-S-isoprenylcysteine O-methyltransferase Ste14
MEAAGSRTEPLVVAGPYRLVRHPLYSGVDGLTLGMALLVDHPWAYIGALALGLWFAFVLAPFEERELKALFGAAYAEYMMSVRRFLPFPRERPR